VTEPDQASDKRPTYEELLARLARLEQQQQQQQQDLLLERERLHALVNGLPDDVFFVDASGKVVLVNDAVRSSLGISEKEDLHGRLADAEAMFEVYTADGRRRGPDESPFLRALKGEVVQGEETVRNVKTGELRHREYRVAPVFLGGKLAGAVSSVRDITERKRTQEDLRQSEARFRSVLDDSRDVIYRVNVQTGRYEYISPSATEVMGYTPEELMAMDIPTSLPLIHPDDAPAMREAVARLEKTGRSDVEYRQRSKNGEYRWVSNRMSLVRDDYGRPLYRGGNIRDVTEGKRVEEEVSRAERTFSELVERAPFGIYIVDSRFRIAMMNAGSQTGAFRNVRPVIGRDFSEAMHILWPESVAAGIIAAFRHTLDTGEPYYSPPFVNPRHDEPIVEAYEWELHRIVLPGGQHGVICYYFDSTELRRAEAALRESEERFRVMADGCPEPLWVTDAEGGNLFVNRAYCEFFRVTIEQANGGQWRPFVHEEDAPTYLAAFLHAVRDRAPFVGEVRARHADGEWRWLSTHAAPRLSPSGKYLGHVGISADITARRQVEEALERTNLKLAEVLDSIQDDFYVLNREWRFAFASRQFTSRIGKRPEDFVGKNIWEMFPKHLGTFYEENLRAAMEKRETRRFEIGGKYTDAWYRMTVSPSAEGVTVLGTEVTENKRMENALLGVNARLIEADQRKNEFMAVLSHELRNPLAPITNSLYILDRAVPGGEEAKNAQMIIERQVRQLTRIVDDLLDVTRIARGKIRLQRDRLEMNDLIRRTIEDHRALFEGIDLMLEFEPSSSPVYVDGDWNRLGQCLGNLLQNAAKFTGQGGRVTVSVLSDPVARKAVLRVADTGIGMTAEVLSRLFEPFMQADVTLDRSQGGLGLGLALVKGIVELHGGEVSAHSEGLGRGTEFVIRLPLDLTETTRSDDRPAATPVPARRVLIIEDNVDAAESLRLLLAYFGHELAVAYEGLGGIAKAKEFRPEVLLCDIGLPGMDGYDVARAFRADEDLRETFLVALSGYALPEDLQRAAEAGFDRHMAKPPNLEKLQEVLTNLSR
jgi:PAS domain S-box-containing protein